MAIEHGKAQAPRRSIRLEVCVLWGDSVVHLRSFRRPRSVSLGEALDCDLRVPAARIGTPRLQLVDFDGAGRPFVLVPASAYGHVVGPDGRELATAYRGGPSSRTRCAQQRIPLLIGNSVTIELGEMVVLVTAFEENAALRRTASSMRAWRGQAFSFALHMAALIAIIALGWGEETLLHAQVPERGRLVRIGDDDSHELHTYQPWGQWTAGGEYGIPPAPVESGPIPLARRSEPDWGEDIPFGRTFTVVQPSEAHEAAPSPSVAPELKARDNPSRFVVVPKGAALGRLRARVSNDATPPPRVEDLLYAFAQKPVSAIGALPLLTRVDAVPSPYDTEQHFARVVLQAPSKVGMARKRVFVVEASTPLQARAQRVVQALTEGLPPGSRIAVVSYGDDAQVELEGTRDRSVGLLRSVIKRASGRPHGGDTLALEKGLQLAIDAGCVYANTPTDIVLLFDNAVQLSSSSIRSVSDRLLSPACANTNVHGIRLRRGDPSYRLLDFVPTVRIGRQDYVDGQSDTLELDRIGDPLVAPAAVDVIVEVQFDPDKVFSHRLIGYEDALNPEPQGSPAWGRERRSSIRAGEQITALYDLRLLPGQAPGLEVRVTYRVPGEPEVRHITHRLTKDKTYETTEAAPRDLRHALAVVGFGEYLRKSPYLAESSLDKVLRLASRSSPQEVEFTRLVQAERRARAPRAWLLDEPFSN